MIQVLTFLPPRFDSVPVLLLMLPRAARPRVTAAIVLSPALPFTTSTFSLPCLRPPIIPCKEQQFIKTHCHVIRYIIASQRLVRCYCTPDDCLHKPWELMHSLTTMLAMRTSQIPNSHLKNGTIGGNLINILTII